MGPDSVVSVGFVGSGTASPALDASSCSENIAALHDFAAIERGERKPEGRGQGLSKETIPTEPLQGLLMPMDGQLMDG